MLQGAIAKDQWIFDGNQTSSFPARVARVDTFIFLDLPTYPRLWRAITRMIKNHGMVRVDSAEGCPERFDLWFMKWVVSYRGKRRVGALDAMHSALAEVTCYHPKSRKNVRQFLNKSSIEHDKT